MRFSIICIFLLIFSSELSANSQQNAERIINKLMKDGFPIKDKYVTELVKIGEPAVIPMTKSLLLTKGWGHSELLEALGKIGDPRAIRPILEAYKISQEWDIKRKRTYNHIDVSSGVPPALLGIGVKAIPVLVETLKSNKWYMRELAAITLLLFDPLKLSHALAPLMEATSDSNKRVKISVVKALGHINDPAALPALIKMLNDKNVYVRSSAVKALGDINDSAALPKIIPMLSDMDAKVRINAHHALSELKWNPVNELEKLKYYFAAQNWKYISKMGYIAFSHCASALNDNQSYYGYSSKIDYLSGAADCLGDIQDDRAVPLLIEAFTRKQQDYTFMRKDLPDLRISAIKALGKINSHKSFRYLLLALDDKNEEVRAEAAFALGEHGDDSAVRKLFMHITDYSISFEVSNALNKLNWIPENDAQIIHVMMGLRNREQINNNFGIYMKVISDDLLSKSKSKIHNALFSFIGIGNEKGIPTLVKILRERGDRDLAEAYLNSRSNMLATAAKQWARENGYHISTKHGSAAVTWGSW